MRCLLHIERQTQGYALFYRQTVLGGRLKAPLFKRFYSCFIERSFRLRLGNLDSRDLTTGGDGKGQVDPAGDVPALRATRILGSHVMDSLNRRN